MRTEKCTNAGLYVWDYKDGPEWVIRLDLSVTENGQKYRSRKRIRTHIPGTPRKRNLAARMAAQEMDKFNEAQVRCPLHPYVDEWLPKQKGRLEETTYVSYESMMKYILPYLEDVEYLDEITPVFVQEYYDKLFNRKNQRTGKFISNRTIEFAAKTFKKMMKDAVILDYIRKNPCDGIPIPKRPKSFAEKPYISESDVATFLELIRGHRLEAMFILILFYGLRREEVCALKWDAVRDGKLHIERAVVQANGRIEKDRTKTGESHRKYPISPQINMLLSNIRLQQEQNKATLKKKYKDNGYIFTWENGEPIKPDYLTRSFKKIVKSSELLDDNLTLHTLRVSCVSIMVHKGVDVKDVQQWVGHSDVSMTLQVYTRVNQKDLSDVADQMENVIFSETNASEIAATPYAPESTDMSAEICARIRNLIDEQYSGNQKLFSYTTGISPSSISEYVTGRHVPTKKTIDKIAAACQINPLWIMGFDVPSDAYDKQEDIKLTQEERRLVQAYRELPDDIKGSILQMAGLMGIRAIS